jgi:hypothetical protein
MTAIETLTAVRAHTAIMRAVVHREYGEPEALRVGEVVKPAPGDDDLLIRVVAACASIGDYHIITGKPYLVRLSPFGGFWSLAETGAALHYVGPGHSRGLNVVRVSG